jgi:hypothetical protein
MLKGWVNTAEAACNVANKKGFKNTSCSWFEPPDLEWRPAWFPEDLNFRHVTGIKGHTSFRFKFLDANQEATTMPGVMLGRQTSESKRWRVYGLLPSLNLCKRCSNRFLRAVKDHDKGDVCPSLPKHEGRFKTAMIAAHRAFNGVVGREALGEEAWTEFQAAVRRNRESTACDVTAGQDEVPAARAVAAVAEPGPAGEEVELEDADESGWDDADVEICLDDLVVGELAIILSSEIPPNPSFQVVKVLATHYSRGSYDVQWYGDVPHIAAGKPERRKVKQSPLVEAATNQPYTTKDITNKVIVPKFRLTKGKKIPATVIRILQKHPDCPWDWDDDCCYE